METLYRSDRTEEFEMLFNINSYIDRAEEIEATQSIRFRFPFHLQGLVKSELLHHNISWKFKEDKEMDGYTYVTFKV